MLPSTCQGGVSIPHTSFLSNSFSVTGWQWEDSCFDLIRNGEDIYLCGLDWHGGTVSLSRYGHRNTERYVSHEHNS